VNAQKIEGELMKMPCHIIYVTGFKPRPARIGIIGYPLKVSPKTLSSKKERGQK
jgi:hypothetical protein